MAHSGVMTAQPEHRFGALLPLDEENAEPNDPGRDVTMRTVTWSAVTENKQRNAGLDVSMVSVNDII